MSSAAAAIPVPTDSPQARRYNRVKRWLGVSDFVLGLVLLVALLVTGWSNSLRDLAYRAAFQNYTLAVFLYVLMLMTAGKLLGLGLEYYGFRLERRFQLSNQRLRSWVWDEFKAFLVGLVIATIFAELLYFILRQAPQYWWFIAWATFLMLFVLMAQLAPVVLFPIFYKFEPLKNEELKARLVRLSEQAGTQVRGVYQWKLSEKSKKANAALTGLGATRRIILADTLLDNYSADEIEAVLAHELGHHVHRHILKSIAVQAGITLIGFWAANWILHYTVDRMHMFETLSDFANLPLLALVSIVLSLLVLPALNAYSRYNERQADRYAFCSIPKVDPFISSMNKLAQQNLAERSPSKWVEWFFHSHPAISRRVAAAEAWERMRPRAV
ncbi:MAG TPA: M48 family metallopeptidase [Terriglobales bacterium]|jgi:STE24 endopeptidase|nr:M48 family metallopeptidase [Terriglobales bacterium]